MNKESDTSSSLEQQSPLITTPIKKLFTQMAMPMVLGMIINGLYNLVDAFFVSHYIGENALAAVSIVFPLQMIIIALATTVSNGTSILASQFLGANQPQKVGQTIQSAISLILFYSFTIAAMSFVFTTKLMHLLAVPETLQKDVYDYFMPLTMVSILIFTLSLLTDLLRAQGLMRALFIGILVSAVANVVLDWLFIGVFNWKVSGAVAATLFGQLIGCLIGIYYLTRHMSLITLLRHSRLFEVIFAARIIALATPVLLQYIGAAMIIAIINTLIGKAIDSSNTLWLSSYGIIGRFNIFIILPLIAMTNAAQTIISFNHGNGIPERVRQALRHGIKANIKYLFVVACILLLIPEFLLAGFTNDSAIIETGSKIARMMFLLLPLAGISFVTVAYFQGIGKENIALLLTSTKVYLLIIPSLFLINLVWGYQKLWYAFPVADIITVMLAAYLLKLESKNNPQMAASGER